MYQGKNKLYCYRQRYCGICIHHVNVHDRGSQFDEEKYFNRLKHVAIRQTIKKSVSSNYSLSLDAKGNV